MTLRDQIDHAIAVSVNSVKRRLQAVEEKANHQPQIVLCKTAAGGIPAMAGSTPGKATDLVEYKFAADDSLEATGRTLTGYHICQTAVAGNTWIMLIEFQGRLITDVEDCG